MGTRTSNGTMVNEKKGKTKPSRGVDSRILSQPESIAKEIETSSSLPNDLGEKSNSPGKRDKLTLEQSEERYRSLVTATALVVWTTNDQGEVIDDIPTWREFTGQTFDEIKGRGWAQALHPDDRKRTAAIWSHAVANRTKFVTDYRMRHHSGEYRLVLARGVPLFNQDGSIREWVGICEDITLRREASDHFHATNALLELFATKSTRGTYLEALADLIQKWTGSRCVGIRVLDNQRRIPYEAHIGFDQDFWQLESNLYLDDIQCACTRVVLGTPDPQDLAHTTSAGSFHCSNTATFAATLRLEEKSRFRGTCIHRGFTSVSIIPIRYRTETIAAIHLADEREGAISNTAVALIESITPLIGEALHRFKLEEELRRHFEKQAALYAVTAAATTLLDPTRMLEAVLEAILPVLGTDAGWVTLPGPQPEDPPQIPASRGLSQDFIAAEIASPLRTCPVCGSMAMGIEAGVQPQLLIDCPRIPIEVSKKAGLHSHVSIPLMAGTQRLGFLNIAWHKDRPYSQADSALLTSIGGQVGSALEKAQLIETSRKHAQQLAMLNEIGQAASSSLDLDAVLKNVLERCRDATNADTALAALKDELTGDLVIHHAIGTVSAEAIGFRVPPNEGLAGWVLQHRQSVHVRDSDLDSRVQPRKKWVLGFDAHELVAVPLITRDKAIGVLELFNKRDGTFSSSDVSFLESVAIGAAAAIENARLFDQVRTSRERLQSLSRQLVEVQESERRRIARELHDEAGQTLTSLKIGLHLLEKEIGNPEMVDARLLELKQAANDVLENLHTLATNLHPASLDYLGLLTTLRHHVQSFINTSKLEVQFNALGFGSERLPIAIETALYRINQESLTNILRHARATKVSILLEQCDDRIILIIEDDGVGFDTTAVQHGEHLGMVGMRERAEMLGGKLRVESRTGGGTTIIVEVPHVT